ncbi:hypothetical protein B0H63DRAFT_455034 [Podospora didyma]|uniref:Uncharacterized protein n=1 Tax=Podospora didyma TaxID=330526 RepID=A0AAE0K1C2_9PEZI|nr:hypothetical protein B0H63DRAFT_455034 [Podospora didyma]
MALPRDMFGDCEYSALQRLAELLYLTDIEHDTHHGLDRKLVQWCLSLLQMEISIRVDFLRIYLRGPSKNNNGDVANRDGVGLDVKNLSDLLECLTGIATLYFEPPCFNRYFGDGTGRQHRFATVKSKCPACVLSVVGGRRDLLSVLRANMLARTKKKTPRLLPLIEAWIDNLGTVTAKRRRDSSRAAEIIAGMRRHSDGIRAQLISVRKRLNEHREAREHGGEKRDDSGMRLRSSRRGGTTPSLTRTSDGVPLPSQRFFSRADGTYRWRRGVGGEGEEVLPKATAGMQNGSKDDALALGPCSFLGQMKKGKRNKRKGPDWSLLTLEWMAPDTRHELRKFLRELKLP